jgi:hypothetical protein
MGCDAFCDGDDEITIDIFCYCCGKKIVDLKVPMNHESATCGVDRLNGKIPLQVEVYSESWEER